MSPVRRLRMNTPVKLPLYLSWSALKKLLGWPYGRSHTSRLESDPKYHQGDPFPLRGRIGRHRNAHHSGILPTFSTISGGTVYGLRRSSSSPYRRLTTGSVRWPPNAPKLLLFTDYLPVRFITYLFAIICSASNGLAFTAISCTTYTPLQCLSANSSVNIEDARNTANALCSMRYGVIGSPFCALRAELSGDTNKCVAIAVDIDQSRYKIARANNTVSAEQIAVADCNHSFNRCAP